MRHRFPGDEPTCSGQRELGFMLWAGTSCVLKSLWCLQEETEMRKIRLRLANGNLGAKWQNSAVVKGSASAAIIPTTMPPPTSRQPPKDTGSLSCRGSEQKAPGCPTSAYGPKTSPRATEGILKLRNWVSEGWEKISDNKKKISGITRIWIHFYQLQIVCSITLRMPPKPQIPFLLPLAQLHNWQNLAQNENEGSLFKKMNFKMAIAEH